MGLGYIGKERLVTQVGDIVNWIGVGVGSWVEIRFWVRVRVRLGLGLGHIAHRKRNGSDDHPRPLYYIS